MKPRPKKLPGTALVLSRLDYLRNYCTMKESYRNIIAEADGMKRDAFCPELLKI